MPPDDRQERARALLDQPAADDVRREPRASVPPAPADPDMVGITFESELYRYAADWLKNHKAEAATSLPFAIILSRSIAQDEALLTKAGASGVQNYHAFRSQTMINLQGRVVFATMNFEHAIALPVTDVANAQHLFECINSLGCKDRQMGVFEPPHANLILLRSGLQSASRRQTVIESGSVQPWTIEQLENEITQFHNDFTRTPSGVLEPWSNAGLGITCEKLEVKISKTLAHILDMKWANRGSVLAEVGTPSGRMDVFVTQQVLATGAGPCVIEIKVLRSNHFRMDKKSSKARKVSPKSNIQWARKGVVQANLYRNDKSASCAYLCCFDAREKEADLPEVDDLAKKLSVEHRKYFMHRTTGSLQAEVLANAGAT